MIMDSIIIGGVKYYFKDIEYNFTNKVDNANYYTLKFNEEDSLSFDNIKKKYDERRNLFIIKGSNVYVMKNFENDEFVFYSFFKDTDTEYYSQITVSKTEVKIENTAIAKKNHNHNVAYFDDNYDFDDNYNKGTLVLNSNIYVPKEVN